MIPNVKPSQLYPFAGLITFQGGISPQSVAAAGVVNGAWIKVPPGSKWLLIKLLSGALGGGSEQVDVEQATSAAGAGAKALLTAAIAGQNVNARQDETEVNLDGLDINNLFVFVRVKITNTGGTGALVAVGTAFGPQAFSL